MTFPTQFLNPKLLPVQGRDGEFKDFVISHFPATVGREIVTQYPLTAIPKIGDYKTNEALMLRMMAYVAVVVPAQGDAPERCLELSTRTLVDNHVGDHERLMRLEWALMEYNCSFFGNGKASTFFETIAEKGKALIIQTLTDFSRQSSPKA